MSPPHFHSVLSSVTEAISRIIFVMLRTAKKKKGGLTVSRGITCHVLPSVTLQVKGLLSFSKIQQRGQGIWITSGI